jgi:hypothetical protein
VFAAGVLLFECLTGRRPWKGEDAAEVAWRIRDTDPTSLADLLPAAGSALRDFVARLIDKDPGRRPPADQATRAAEALLAADNRPLPSRLVQNRLALVLADGDLANLLTAVLASESVLAPLVAVTHPADARLRGLLPELDAILLDPTCAPPKEVAAFVGEVRVRFPWVVFFLVVDKARRKDVLVGFEPEWRERLGHYFLFSPDRPVRELPVAVRGLAAKIYGDRAVGRSSPPPAE